MRPVRLDDRERRRVPVAISLDGRQSFRWTPTESMDAIRLDGRQKNETLATPAGLLGGGAERCDPYVKMTVNGAVCQSKTVQGSLQPEWDETKVIRPRVSASVSICQHLSATVSKYH